MGWYTRQRLSQDYLNAILPLDSGEISEPILVGKAYHLFRVNQKKDHRALTLEDDYSAIQKMALGEKLGKELERKLQIWRTDFHVVDNLYQFES